jgi:hypothetical protein
MMMHVRTGMVSLAVIAAALSFGGCAGRGQLALRSASSEAAIEGQFNTAVFGYDDVNTLHVVLIEGSVEQPEQAVHMQMFWRPKAGRTPRDPMSANTTVRYMVFQDGQVGVYGGAGLLAPKASLTRGQLNGSLQNASLRLTDASGEFVDELKLANASGDFSAKRDDETALKLLRQLQVQVRERLGYPRFVDAKGMDKSAG